MGVNLCTESSHAAGQHGDAHLNRGATDSTELMNLSAEGEGTHSQESSGEDAHMPQMNRDTILQFAATRPPRAPPAGELPHFSRLTTTPSPVGSAPGTPRSPAWSLENSFLKSTSPKGSGNSDLTHLTSRRELSRDDSKSKSTMSDLASDPLWVEESAQQVTATECGFDKSNDSGAVPGGPNMFASIRSGGSSGSRQLRSNSETGADPNIHFAVDSLTTTACEANFQSLDLPGSWGAEQVVERTADF